MASGGSGSNSGSGFFKKKVGLLTPKLRKKETAAAKAREKEVEKENDKEILHENGSSSTVKLRKKETVAAKAREKEVEKEDDKEILHENGSSSTATVSSSFVQTGQGAGTPQVGDCEVNAFCAGGRLSTSSENLCPNINKAAVKRKSKTLTLRRKKTENNKSTSKQGSKLWTFRIKKRLPIVLTKRKEHGSPKPTPALEGTPCVCTSYRRTDDLQTQHTSNSVMFASPGTSLMGASASPMQPNSTRTARLALGAGPGPTGVRRYNPQLFQFVPAPQQTTTIIDIGRTNPDDYPTEDIDELMIAQRARDMELGIEISPSHFAYPHLHYSSSVSSSSSSSGSSTCTISEPTNNLSVAFQNQCVVTTTTLYPGPGEGMIGREAYRRESEYGEFNTLSAPSSAAPACYIPRTVHTQVDYIHCLVPDLKEITKCSFYWGVIDRYEAERLLENRPEGTFLLRDSAQEEFLFSVSFRRYGRSLHARIEQWNHKFSFDSHDPGVFAADTVCGLIEHYKDPSCCMFFEPMLTIPLTRTFPFSLQHLCRTIICSTTTYDGLNYLPLPNSLREYLKYYHYKQKVRVRRFEVRH